ncbi:MAG: U32 family peptidase [Methanomassiliicoccus sp.]|nr:U32 family peptidase [Methanomassiliicoccus sp.]
MEVLAPAGSKESFKAALAGGADAIYLGGKLFGARRFAQNFSDPELAGAVRLAHSRGVKVYVTVNVLIKERELPLAYDYLDVLDRIGVDAVIVQDRGLARLILDNYGMPVHASTQMGIHSPEDARWAESMGMKRAILARELGLEEVERVRSASNIGIEVFIHGALCYAFSGQCLFSSVLGGRSGNRGMCAQPCRKRYTLGKETAYLLSTADLFSVDALPALMRMGVEAVKIEGRLRSPTYVYLASKVYKAAVERASRGEEELITPRERELLSVAFNRGFSSGYLLTDKVMQRSYPESRGLPLGTARSEGRTVRVHGAMQEGDGITFYRDGEKIGGFEVRAPRREGDQTVVASPFRLELGEYAAYKTKDREFPAIEREISAIPISDSQVKRRRTHLDLPTVERPPRQGELSFYISSIPSLEAVLPCAGRVYFDAGPHLEEAIERCRASGVEIVANLPRVTMKVPPMPSVPLMVSSPGQAFAFPDRRLYGSYFMNVFNSLSKPELYQSTLSVELSRDDLKDLTAHHRGRLEVMVFGRVELMVTRDPSLSEGTLIDERGARFPVFRDHCGYAHILNSSDLFLLDFLGELDRMGIDSYGIDLRQRPADLCSLVAKAFHRRDLRSKDRIKRRVGSITAGHYLRGVQ